MEAESALAWRKEGRREERKLKEGGTSSNVNAWEVPFRTELGVVVGVRSCIVVNRQWMTPREKKTLKRKAVWNL